MQGGDTSSAAAADSVRVEFRHIQAISCKGNRRVRIEPDGRVFADLVTRDCPPGVDWNGPWPIAPVRTLDGDERARLRDLIDTSGFFALPTSIARAGHDGFRDELDVALGPRRHSVVVERTGAPPAFARVRAAVLAAAEVA